MFCQRLWDQIAKIAAGLLSGIALVELCAAFYLYQHSESTNLNEFFNLYEAVCTPFLVFCPIFLVVILVALCDWIDLAHMNLQHLWDTYLHRSIWMVMPFFLGAFVIFLSLRSSGSNYIQLHSFHLKKRGNHTVDEGFRDSVGNWEVFGIAQNFVIVLGWIFLVMTRNDDLFLLHLQCMKKYDIGRAQNYLV